MKKSYIVVAFLSFFLFIFSCHKDDNTTNNPSVPSNNVQATITGMVVDENNASLSGVTVTAGSGTVTTNATGTFILQNISVNKDRAVVHFSKGGYMDGVQGFVAKTTTTNYVRIVLLNQPVIQTITASSGGTINLTGGISVQLPANSFIKTDNTSYSGAVSVGLKHLSPDNPIFGLVSPGGDFAGNDTAGNAVALYSYGMLGVELTGSGGEKLQLATGSTATITMPVAASQLSTAPSTIPLWYFDEATALWIEQGQATLSGGKYTGTVTHFTWWNCDYSGVRATIKGRVLDCNGIPLSNAVVTVNTNMSLTTDDGGNYQSWVPGGMPLTMQVLASKNNNIGSNSQLENVSALTGGQTFTVPDLLVSTCPTRIAGTITGCNSVPGKGMVYVSWPGGSNFTYCTSGSFTVAVPANTSLEIKMYVGSAGGNLSVTSGSASSVTNIGNTVLCDDGAQTDNSFYVNGNIFNNELVVIDTSSTSAYSPYIQTLEMKVSGFRNSDGSPVELEFSLWDTIPKTYLLVGLDRIGISVGGRLFSSHLSSGATCTLNQVQPVGGRITGTFSGTFAVFDSLQPATPITITNGKFNITRTN